MLQLLLLVIPVVYGTWYIFKKWLEKSWGCLDPSDERDVTGRIALITGGNSGIGKATTCELARRGCVCIMACRNMSSAAEAAEDIRKETSAGELIPMKVDLGSLDSVRRFCASICKAYPRIDILVNNAGVMFPIESRAKTGDGLELHFGVNHLSHFLLTNLLLPLLKNSDSSRVVTISSMTYRLGKLDFDDIMSERVSLKESWTENQLYANSKLANVLFSQELGRRLQGTNVHSYCLCVGIVNTNIVRNLVFPFFLRPLEGVVKNLFKTPKQGSQTVLHCCLSKKCSNESGKMYRNCKLWNESDIIFHDLFVSRGNPSTSPEDAQTLWDISQRLVRL